MKNEIKNFMKECGVVAKERFKVIYDNGRTANGYYYFDFDGTLIKDDMDMECNILSGDLLLGKAFISKNYEHNRAIFRGKKNPYLAEFMEKNGLKPSKSFHILKNNHVSSEKYQFTDAGKLMRQSANEEPVESLDLTINYLLNGSAKIVHG